MKTRNGILVILGIALIAALSTASCGKSVGRESFRLGQQDPTREAPVVGPGGGGTDPTPLPSGVPTLPPARVCNERKSWSFEQPELSVNRSVDLLFVVDSSSSMREERQKLAEAIPHFVEKISPLADLRAAVMLAHGGASPRSGRLFSPRGVPKVLDASRLTRSDFKAHLEATLRAVPQDRDFANGEMGMYSFMRSMKGWRRWWIQRQGFYRPDAALAVVFVTDENDACFRPQEHGPLDFPNFVASQRGWEDRAYQRYCRGVTPDRVLQRARRLKKNGRLTVAGIVHTDATQVPAREGSEDAIGHGILELVQETVDGVAFDITQATYEQGLVRLADAVESRLELELEFALEGAGAIDPETVEVYVDERRVTARFDERLGRVEIAAADAGRAGSRIQVLGCLR
jgi:hypothetical protein